MHIAVQDPDFAGYDVGTLYIRDCKAEDLRKEHRDIQKLASGLMVKGVNAEGLIIQGATIEMIINESKRLNIDLIIAGHHEYGFFLQGIRR